MSSTILKRTAQITRMLPKYSIGRKIATQDGIQYITVTNDKRYTKMEFLQLFHIILWVIYETYTGRRKKDIIPSFAYCLCKETVSSVCFPAMQTYKTLTLPHPSVDKSKFDTYQRYLVIIEIMIQCKIEFNAKSNIMQMSLYNTYT